MHVNNKLFNFPFQHAHIFYAPTILISQWFEEESKSILMFIQLSSGASNLHTVKKTAFSYIYPEHKTITVLILITVNRITIPLPPHDVVPVLQGRVLPKSNWQTEIKKSIIKTRAQETLNCTILSKLWHIYIYAHKMLQFQQCNQRLLFQITTEPFFIMHIYIT